MFPDTVLQQLGLYQPPPPAVTGPPLALDVPPAPESLPAPEPQRGEFVVPQETFGQPGALGQGGFEPPAPTASPQLASDIPAERGPAAPPPAAVPQSVRPMTADQQLQRAQQKQGQADVSGAEAIAAQRDVATQRARDELAANQAFEQRAKEIEDQRKAFADASTKVRAQKEAYVMSTMQEADNYKVDRSKHMKEMGLGTKIGWGIAMIMSNIGAAMQGRGGGNAVLEMLQKEMHDSVEAQMDERDQLRRKNAAAQHDLDKYDNFSAKREAQIALLDAQNEKRLANMIRAAGAKAAEPAVQANALDAVAKLEKSSAENAQKAAEFAAGHEMQQKQLAVSRGNLAIAGRNQSLAERKFAWDVEHDTAKLALEQQKRELEAQKLEREGKNAEAKLLRERGFGGEAKLVEIDPKDIKPGDKVIKKDGKSYLASLGHITMRDGKPFIPHGEESVIADAQKKYMAHMRLRGTVNEMLRLGPEYLSATVNSDKYQQLKQEFHAGLLDILAFKGMGAPQGKDMEIAVGYLGSRDPGGWYDATAGLKQALKSMERDQASTFKSLGLDKEWKAPDDTIEQESATPTQKALTALKAKPSEAYEVSRDLANADAYRASKAATPEQRLIEARTAGTTAAERARAGQIDVYQTRALRELETAAIGGDADALAALEDAAKNGSTPMIKALAGEALRAVASASVPDPAAAVPPPDPLRYNNTRDPLSYNPEDLIRRFQTPAPSPRTRNAPPP